MVMEFLVGVSWGEGRLYLQWRVASVDGGGMVMGNDQHSGGRHGHLGWLVLNFHCLGPVNLIY